MLTYNDFTALGDNERERCEFILRAISEHVSSEAYRTAVVADEYYHLKNPTIMRLQKVVYDIYGKAVPDIWRPNHKIPSNWYRYFVQQAVGHLLSNGVFFENDDTKARLGKNFDRDLVKLAAEAHNGGVAYGFWNYDRVVPFSVREFKALPDMFTGAIGAGIRFWQLDAEHPMMVTLYEPDGVTEYIRDKDEQDEFQLTVRVPKQGYKRVVSRSMADGEVIADGGNYGRLPIVPLYMPLRQSEIVGNRHVIDAYDLIASGLINNTDEANFIYWVLTNCDGMNDEDDNRFLARMVKNHIAHANGDDGAKVEAHTVETPVDAHKFSLEELRGLLFTNFQAVDVQKIAAGNTTATEIRAAYEPLNAKSDMFEGEVTDFIEGICGIAGIDDVPTYRRAQVANELEDTQKVMLAAEYLDDETVLEKLPWISVDEIPDIMQRRIEEESARFADEKNEPDGGDGE